MLSARCYPSCAHLPDLEPIRDDKGKQRATVSVNDEEEEEDGYDQNSYAPGNDPDYFAEEDEDVSRSVKM